MFAAILPAFLTVFLILAFPVVDYLMHRRRRRRDPPMVNPPKLPPSAH